MRARIAAIFDSGLLVWLRSGGVTEYARDATPDVREGAGSSGDVGRT